MKKFKKAQWKAMRIVTEADAMRAQIRATEDGDMWLWKRSDGNGSVWADKFTQFPYRNDLHRLMSTICKPSKKAGAQ